MSYPHFNGLYGKSLLNFYNVGEKAAKMPSEKNTKGSFTHFILCLIIQQILNGSHEEIAFKLWL